MRVSCPQCETSYTIPKSSLPEPEFDRNGFKGWKMFCLSCDHRWFFKEPGSMKEVLLPRPELNHSFVEERSILPDLDFEAYEKKERTISFLKITFFIWLLMIMLIILGYLFGFSKIFRMVSFWIKGVV